MNDLSHISRFSVTLFADDTCLVLSHTDLKYLETICNNELNIVDDWFKANKLTANLKKASKYMLTVGKINSKKYLPEIELKMGNTTLERVPTIKYLGVTLDESFNWSAHVDQLKKKTCWCSRYYFKTEILR